MTTTISTMPKSINSKKNGRHQTGAAQSRVKTAQPNVSLLKELSGQVAVSAEQYKSNPDCFLGNPGDNLRLMDGREVVLACEIENMAFSLDRMCELLFGSTLLLGYVAISDDDSFDDAQTYMHLARAYNVYCTLKEFLFPGKKWKDLRKFVDTT